MKCPNLSKNDSPVTISPPPPPDSSSSFMSPFTREGEGGEGERLGGEDDDESQIMKKTDEVRLSSSFSSPMQQQPQEEGASSLRNNSVSVYRCPDKQSPSAGLFLTRGEKIKSSLSSPAERGRSFLRVRFNDDSTPLIPNTPLSPPVFFFFHVFIISTPWKTRTDHAFFFFVALTRSRRRSRKKRGRTRRRRRG